MMRGVIHILLNDSGVSALVGDRVFPSRRPQDEEALPAIICEHVRVDVNDTKQKSSQLDLNVVRVTIFSESYLVCDEVADAVRSALDQYVGTSQGVHIHHVRLDQRSDGNYEDVVELHSIDLIFEVFVILDGQGPNPPSGDQDPVTVRNLDDSFVRQYSPGTDNTLPSIALTQVSGQVTEQVSNKNLVCAWAPISLIDGGGNPLGTITGFPAGGVYEIDIQNTHTDSGGQQVSTELAENFTATPCSTPDPIPILDIDDVEVGSVVANDTIDLARKGMSVGRFGQVVTIDVPLIPRPIDEQEPYYTDSRARSFVTAWNAGEFDKWDYNAFRCMELGDDPYTLSAETPNKFNTLYRYTSTDGTPPTAGTVTFTTYGNGVENIVIDHLYGIRWYVANLGQCSDNTQESLVTTKNTEQLGGFSNWRAATDNEYVLSAWPNRQQDPTSGGNVLRAGVVSGFNPSQERALTCRLRDQSTSQVRIMFIDTGNIVSQSRSFSSSTSVYIVNKITQSEWENLGS